MEQRIGIVPLGSVNTEIYIDTTTTGGSLTFAPDKQSLPKIVIGLDYEDWDDCLAVALHETMEFLLAWKGYRYRKANAYSRDHGSYWFHFDHIEFTELCCHQAFTLMKLIPMLSRVFEVRNNPRQLAKVVKELSNA